MSALQLLFLTFLGSALKVGARRNAKGSSSQVDLSTEELPDCMSIENFPGKCHISVSPGACYTLDDSDPTWQCWNNETAAESRTDADCKDKVGKAGACVFKEREALAKKTDTDLPNCQDVGVKSHCHPIKDMWGACYTKDSSNRQCITKDNEGIGGYRTGDCKTTPVEVNSTVAFDDVCVFRDVEQSVFKCPSVPSFKKDDPAASCTQEGVSYACFSLREGVTWQCVDDNASVPSCISIEIPKDQQAEEGETYDGVCVHEGSSSWKAAKKGDKLSIRTTSTTVTKTTTSSTSQQTSETTTQTPASTSTTTKSGTVKSQLGFAAVAVLAVLLKASLM
jgi:hypothetical protein